MANEKEKGNIYQRLQKSRVELQQRDLKQTGSNTYSNYIYFELGDFLPQINEICQANGICPIFQFNKEEATLTIFNVDNLTEHLIFTTPVDIPTIKGCSSLQNIGGAQTFVRRYLYTMAFEISDTDTVNNGVDPEEELKKQKISPAKKVIINKLIDETHTDMDKFLKVVGFKSVQDITEGAFTEVLKMLKDKKEKLEKIEAAATAEKLKKEKELGGAF